MKLSGDEFRDLRERKRRSDVNKRNKIKIRNQIKLKEKIKYNIK